MKKEERKPQKERLKEVLDNRYVSGDELANRKRFLDLFTNRPIPDDEILSNLPVFMKRQDLSRVLFFNDLYQRILDVHGVVIEFGVRWGRDLAVLASLRGIYEPFNYNRRILGFDTFEGYTESQEKDGKINRDLRAGIELAEHYEDFLTELLGCHENESPVAHLRKFDLIKGDAVVEIRNYLETRPETIIAMAYFDLNLYEPTKACLTAIRNHVTKGSLIAFNSLNSGSWPGETLAFQETFGCGNHRLHHSLYGTEQAYIVIE